ncbi:MAG: hypothetical protein IPI67_30160 [Myxococcales bacterium]|nr:hypothetical protein [Myxococcales bacterium]
MTEREVRRRIVWASVVFVSALTIATSFLIIGRVERERTRVVAPAVTPMEPPPTPSQPRFARAQPPVSGLVPAPAPRRRVVAIRRTRAS